MNRKIIYLIVILAAVGYAPLPSPPAPQKPAPQPSEPPLSGRFIFYEDFEKDLSRWTIKGQGGGVAWLRLNAFTCGGAFSMLLGKGEMELFSSVAGESTLALKRPIDLGTAKPSRLAFDVRGVTIPEEAVALQAEGSRDGRSWQAIGPVVHGRNRYVTPIVGDVAPFLGGPLWLRFRAAFHVGKTPIKGMLLDDVKVIELERPRPN